MRTPITNSCLSDVKQLAREAAAIVCTEPNAKEFANGDGRRGRIASKDVAHPHHPHTMQPGPDARHRSKKKRPSTGRYSQTRSPARLRLILDCLAEKPNILLAATTVGIHRNTLRYWLKRSAAGDARYQVTWLDYRAPFHEHFEDAIRTGRARLRCARCKRALGYDKILKYRGRVSYKIDDFMWDLGYRGADAYLKDEKGNPVPETKRRWDKKAMKWALENFLPDVFGKHPKSDVPRQSGGLLIVHMPEPKK